MATDHTTFHNNLTRHHPTTTFFRWPTGPKIHLRRRKLSYVRLGGKKTRPGFVLVRILKRIRLRWWLKLKYSCILKKLKQYYQKMIKDLIEASAGLDSFQQRILVESSFAVPVMGVSFSNFPSTTHLDRPGFM